MSSSAKQRYQNDIRKKNPDSILSPEQFSELSKIIYDNFGINLPESKKGLIPRRLNKRLRELQLKDYGEYLDYVENHWDTEEQILANAITTNLTSFFRENHHFEYLADTIIPHFIESNKLQRKLRIWSAACSTGEEAYSIAMVIKHFESQLHGWDIKILATDLDTNILSKAQDGIYLKSQVNEIASRFYKPEFFEPVMGQNDYLQLIPQLKDLIHFKKLNFLDKWPMKGGFDIIFCRNVLIYFDLPLQKQILKNFSTLQSQKDYLIIGHSEGLHGMEIDYNLVGKTIYQKIT